MSTVSFARAMHHEATKGWRLTAAVSPREWNQPSALGEGLVDGFSDRGSTPLTSTNHTHVLWEITKDVTQLSFACLVASLFVIASIVIDP